MTTKPNPLTTRRKNALHGALIDLRALVSHSNKESATPGTLESRGDARRHNNTYNNKIFNKITIFR